MMTSRRKGLLCSCRGSAVLDRTFEPNVGLAIGRFGFSPEGGSDVVGQVRSAGVVSQRRRLGGAMHDCSRDRRVAQLVRRS